MIVALASLATACGDHATVGTSEVNAAGQPASATDLPVNVERVEPVPSTSPRTRRSFGAPFALEEDEGLPCAKQVGVDEHGNVWVVWMQNLGRSWEARARRYEAASRSWGELNILASGTNELICTVDLSVADDGRAAAAWFLDTADAISVQVSTYDPASGSWRGATLSGRATVAGSIGVTIAAREQATVAYTAATPGEQIEPDTLLVVHRMNAGFWDDGQELGFSPAPESCLGCGYAGEVELVGDGEGGVTLLAAAWVRQAPDTRELSLLGFRSDGDTWSDPALFAGGSSPEAGVMSNGRVLATWLADDGISSSLFYSIYDPMTEEWQQAAKAERLTESVGGRVRLAVHADGNAAVIWGSSGSFGDVYVVTFNPSAGWADPVKLTSVGTGDCSIAVSPNGVATAVWRDPAGGYLAEGGPTLEWPQGAFLSPYMKGPILAGSSDRSIALIWDDDSERATLTAQVLVD